jgi:hypothetical protein
LTAAFAIAYSLLKNLLPYYKGSEDIDKSISLKDHLALFMHKYEEFTDI